MMEGSFVGFIKDYFEDTMSNIDFGMLARVETFDSKKMRADLVPLVKKKSGDQEIEYALIKDIPVSFMLTGGFYIRPDYQKGDLVFVACVTHDIDEALRGGKSLAYGRISSENSFVIGGIAPTGWAFPSEFDTDEGLLIGHRDGSAYMQFCSSSIIHKFGEQDCLTLNKDGIEMHGNIIKMTDAGIDINGGALVISK